MEICHLNAFKDNYIWLLLFGSDVIVVDPGEAKVVADYITANHLNLRAILLTHGHNDHIGGVEELLIFANVPVYGNCDIAQSNKEFVDGDIFTVIPGVTAEVITTPGHTYDGISYFIACDNEKYLFCGDTLFAAGCGRVFTLDFPLMLESLTKIGQLPLETKIFPGHEYTLNNLKFASFVWPNNQDITGRIKHETLKLKDCGITLPTTLVLEKKTNPFLCTNDEDLQNNLSKLSNITVNSELECFIQLRKLKDSFH